ncbi:hypothetical protein CSC74_09460 [Pseudoxanthomonas yeongjuensis]|uniref:hypothetical protein n=1 Tax=Pseudoxanthomonas yeongjuensis TaxID=377616 RepID=UPI0013917BA5|nr:hypothetical protein [Pseudoxanthomonas yeongjuensis]KAF1717073.1 hypothetical protein CSC74_09460 [Pseudoxanthomonas yeongjuensis]
MSIGWDPKVVFKGLQPVARFGFVEVWHGRQVLPRTRAGSMGGKVFEYVYKDNDDDWGLVARRLEEAAEYFPQSASTAIEFGNAYVRMGDGPAAIRAFRRPLDQDKAPVDARMREQMQAQIRRIEAGADLSAMKPLRNPEME